MQSTIRYLLELRKRLLRYLIVLFITFMGFALFANDVYRWLALPLLRHMPTGVGLIATSVPAPFLIPFKSALVAAFFVTIPFLLYQIWAFIAPALYRQEQRLMWLFLFLGTMLFYVGVLFAYLVVLPLVFQFFIYVAPQGVEVKPDISQYFSFTMRLLLAFGLSFELPIVIILLIWSGITTRDRLAQKRPYVIVAAFIIGMLLTPPDVISQILLAVPLWWLYELGLFLSRVCVRNDQQTSSNC